MNTETNKAIVTRYNKEVIQGCDMELLKSLVRPDFINHSGVPGLPGGVDGLVYFFKEILHHAFSDIIVDIKEMLAQGDKVVTRKEITGTHTGTLMGIPATGRAVTLKVIDILAIKEGKISDHWGENNFIGVLQRLSQ